MTVEVRLVDGKKDEDRFLRLPWRIYKDDPAWVPNLLLLQKDVISRKKNPFFDHGEAQLFLAWRDGEVVGRISAQIDRHHNEYHSEQTGYFGFFESINDPEVAQALLSTAESWLRHKGMQSSRGPYSFSITEDFGVLVEGFEHPPMVAMPHATPYYDALLSGSGYGKCMDTLAYRWSVGPLPERMMETIEKARAVPGLSVRKASLRHINRDVGILLDIYNDAWQQTWSYVPVMEREARKLASDLMLIVDTDIAIIAEMDGEPAAMIVGLPNLYEAIRDFKGFIDPVKAAKLIWRLKIRGVKSGRIMLFGVKQKFQHQRELIGLPYLLLEELYKGARKHRYEWGEASWILESNKRMNAIMPHWGAEIYKRYRVYEKAL